MSGDTPLERIEELFHRLVDLAPEEREAILGDVEATEPQVHRSVARVLARADAGRDLSRLGPPAAGDPLAAAAPTAGTVLGHYRIVAELGRGGMGAVSEAEAAYREALDHPRTRGDSRLEGAAYWALAPALLDLGRVGEAERSRDRAVAAQEEAPGIPAGDRLYARARWHSAAGRVDRALDLFEQAVAAGFRDAVALHDPAFRAARADPRFPAFVQPPDPAAAEHTATVQ